ncbi:MULTISPECIES: ribosomal protection-like ABC-F family protein [Acidobacterium]|uniref:ABC transporter, ATP-binding protein n=1 Tax=Acidobacterium capsulatum (strain ATCC 51196 / DSM 11244 / BCRC 80197 / JCM 7670 / NBRC 15755 / NCIMB 13165 / 161) TaxID=240015 RepID=C1F4Y5_ACIC5|nr:MULTISPECIES: ABC-F family ATP-binding cassette domain-containing protein [Acidobacterium]ACO31524.1 ABC transporter, ATP-binding protein [Acidobacterium capsulatum ATCC 51196]HCT61842.1 ABC transporter ATP-binding protein [Acidobacterium sp.]
MLQLADAGKRFGHKLLFEHANWLITPDERTALVGANGTGKSTLMKILAGLDSLDYGAVQRTKGMTIGYLPQDGLALTGRSVFEECLSVFDELRAMEKEFEQLAHSLAELDPSGPEYAAAAERYSHIEGRLRALDGYALDAQVGAVLTGLGFSKTDWTRQTEEFSGGWQMRIALAKLLLARPDLLLLDEPTNHLDLETRNWLENYLKSYPNGFILISHDRYFLDVTVNKIIEVWNKGLHTYHGNYEKYLTQKQERRAQLEAAYRNQRDQIEHLEAFINRFRYQATKAKQVQSRIKELDKIVRIEIPEEEPIIHFTFPQPPASGRTVTEAIHLKKSYGQKEVLTDVNFTIERGDRIALVGANGAGKSTLVRLLSGEDAPSGGSLKLGHNVLVEYFAQDQYKVLDPAARMLDDISRTAPKVPETELRSLLGCFLFSGDDVFKPLGVLSGGERNRYALARILVSPANFLLLDEPTNHLDLRAKDVLLEAIQSFTGTVLFVSHDRYFIDRLATRVFEVENGVSHIYPGNYEEYLWRKEGGPGAMATAISNDLETKAKPAPAPQPEPEPAATPQAAPPPPEKPAKRMNPIKLKQMEDRVITIEEELPRLEASIAEAENALAVFVSIDETKRLTAEMASLREQHAQLTTEWEELVLQLEEASV